MARGSGFEVGPVFSHLLFAVTLFLAAAAWFTAFIGQIIWEKEFQNTFNSTGSGVGVGWFGIFLQLFLIVGIFYTLATDSIAIFRFQIAIFTAIALVFAVIQANNGIYFEESSRKAFGAGWLILSMVDIIWLLYFTSEEDSSLYALLNSFSSGGGRRLNGMSISGPSRRSHRASSVMHMGNGSAIGSGVGHNSAYGGYSGVKAGSNAPSMHNGSISNVSAAGGGGAGGIGGGAAGQPLMQQQSPGGQGGNAGQGGGAPPEYSYRARALYNYTASPDDPNEMSFVKGEELDIIDNSGKWWQARNASGKTGIIPSNYMCLI